MKIICIIGLSCGIAAAQTPAPASAPAKPDTVIAAPNISMMGAPGAVGFVSHEFSFAGSQVRGEPYSAVETTETVQTLSDGNRIVNTTSAKVYRDGEGRMRREVSLSGAKAGASGRTFITIIDPVAGVNWTLDPSNKTAQKMPAPPALLDKLPKLGENTGQIQQRFAVRIASPAQVGPQIRDDAASLPGPPPLGPNKVFFFEGFPGKLGDSKHEDLGTESFEGVTAQGSRETSTIPAGAVGNEKPITISFENWYSPDLQIEMKSIHDDPRAGQTTFTVSNLNRAEPDASLFQVPSDYTIQEPKLPNMEYHRAP